MDPIFQAHPVPQNVTNFEFHLVGDMTLKQFGYLAAGLGFAFLVFTTLSNSQPIIAWPIIIISALLGTAFAFLPIQERPLDHWVAAFFKAIFKPTSLKFSSNIISVSDPLFNRRLNHYLRTYQKPQFPAFPPIPPVTMPASAPVTSKPSPSFNTAKKQNFIDKFKAGQTNFATPLPSEKPTSPSSQVPQPLTQQPITESPQPIQPPVQSKNVSPSPFSSPTPGILRNPQAINQLPSTQSPQPAPAASPAPSLEPKDLKKTVELAKEAQFTQQEIVKIESSLSQIKQQAAQPGVDPKTYVEEFEDLLSQLQKLNDKASNTAKELAEISKASPKAPQPSTPIKAKSIPTLKLTSFPNVINGIVTDSQGNYIEGAIVVAHDKQGLPVRALKSNKLGQFVAATPLPNGEYSIAVEKESLLFDRVGIELKNEILPPILMAAKKLATAS